MSYEISVENIKCGGCANTITTKLNAIDAVEASDVDVENGVVSITGDEAQKAAVTELLLKLGYP